MAKPGDMILNRPAFAMKECLQCGRKYHARTEPCPACLGDGCSECYNTGIAQKGICSDECMANFWRDVDAMHEDKEKE